MRFITFIKLLSLDIEKVGWCVTSYEHLIESGKYHITFQKTVHKFQGGEPVKRIIMKDLIIDELSLTRMSIKELIRNCIIELGIEDVKA